MKQTAGVKTSDLHFKILIDWQIPWPEFAASECAKPLFKIHMGCAVPTYGQKRETYAGMLDFFVESSLVKIGTESTYNTHTNILNDGVIHTTHCAGLDPSLRLLKYIIHTTLHKCGCVNLWCFFVCVYMQFDMNWRVLYKLKQTSPTPHAFLAQHTPHEMVCRIRVDMYSYSPMTDFASLLTLF